MFIRWRSTLKTSAFLVTLRQLGGGALDPLQRPSDPPANTTSSTPSLSTEGADTEVLLAKLGVGEAIRPGSVTTSHEPENH